jgi:hypothetical protein
MAAKQFYCDDCCCGFYKIQHFDRHLASNKHNLRISNDKIHLHSCSICQQTFSHLSGLSRHRAKCKENEVKEVLKVDILEKKVVELSKKVEDLENSKKDTTNINTQNNIEKQNNVNNNIIINCFGRENLEYITDKVIIHCMQHIYGSLPLLIEKIHFDPDHPENHNIKIPNKKLPHAKVLNDKREWQIVNKKEAIDDMMNIGYSMLDDTFQEKGHELPQNKQKHFRNFQEKYEDEDKKTKKNIRNQVENVIIDKTRK